MRVRHTILPISHASTPLLAPLLLFDGLIGFYTSDEMVQIVAFADEKFYAEKTFAYLFFQFFRIIFGH